jgi:glycosyltransferase involved in cell wall biosynthesis
MSRATPLARWHEKGMWERETAIYRHLAKRLAGLAIVTSGDAHELELNPAENVTILNNPQRQSPNVYSLTALWHHRTALRSADLYKTNQMDGAWTAVLAGLIFRKPVIVRAGYLWAKYELDDNRKSLRYQVYRWLSRFSFRRCTHVFLTTPLMKQQVIEGYGIPAGKITVVPNYVDTDLFRPLPDITPVLGRIVFVGRLSAVKNINLLIQGMALAKSDLHGLFVGIGPLKEELKALAEKHEVTIDFVGNRPNEQLPEIINSADIFALVSRFEGHPKALIEAMACQAPVIGSRVMGIKNIIKDGKNGRLCGEDVEGIARVLDEMMADDTAREQMAQNAYTFATNEYSLTKLVEQEIALYQRFVAN